MNTAIFVQTYPKLSETFIRNQVNGLNAKVYCQSRGDYYSIDPSIKPDLVLGELPFFYKFVRKVLGLFNVYFDCLSWHQKKILSKKLIDDKIDIVLIQYGSNAIKVGSVINKLSIPFVIHFHGYDISSLLRIRGYEFLLKKIILKSQALIVVNSIQRKLLMNKFNLDSDKISIIPCGVDTKYFKPKIKEPNSECIFIMIGRLVPKKAPLITLRAFEKAASQTDKIKLIIIGDGPLKNELERFILKSNYGNRIDYLESKTTFEIRDYLAKSDVFLQHSVTAKNGDMEGWPISIAEACSMGLPIISTKHSGIIDQVVNGKNGYLVDEFDENGMSEYILKLGADEKLRASMGIESRNIILKKGNLDDQIEKLRIVLT